MNQSLGITGERVRHLQPAYFALVMATSIVAIACQLEQLGPIAALLTGLNFLIFLVLISLTLARLVIFRREVHNDLINYARAPGFLTIAAGHPHQHRGHEEGAAHDRERQEHQRQQQSQKDQRQVGGCPVAVRVGDELKFCAAVYQVEDETGLIAALESAKPFEAAGDGGSGVCSFAWLEQRREGPRRSYGRIEIQEWPALAGVQLVQAAGDRAPGGGEARRRPAPARRRFV